MHLFLELVCFATVAALHPRPEWNQRAQFARWLVHESDYAIVATHHEGDVFGNVISISDGVGYEDSTGIIYTYMPSLDLTYQDVMKNPNVSISWSEMALEGGTSGGCQNSTAENPPCGRLTIKGQLTKVPESGKELALKSLYARHPVMRDWSGTHAFEPFWMDPASISQIWLISAFGGASEFTVQDYLEANWQRAPPVPDGSVVCSQCGHIYSAEKDGNAAAFEDLPEDWSCPICGAPKVWFDKANGSDVGVECRRGYFLCHVGVIVAVIFAGLATVAALVGCRAVKQNHLKHHADLDTSLQPRRVQTGESA